MRRGRRPAKLSHRYDLRHDGPSFSGTVLARLVSKFKVRVTEWPANEGVIAAPVTGWDVVLQS